MEKPIVVINLSKRPDLIQFVENDVAVGAYRPDDIKGVIKESLYNEDIKRKMRLARKDFISDSAYKVDGKTTERILGLIDNL